MEKLASKSYTDQLKILHNSNEKFGVGSVTSKHYGLIINAARLRNCKSVLDYGCGKGDFLEDEKVKSAFDNVYGYDVANDKYGQLPDNPVDLVVALDVLEHVEWGAMNEVLSTIQRLSTKNFICSIANYPAAKVLPDGRNAHITQLPFGYWFSTLSNYFSVDKFIRTARAEGVFICSTLKPSGDWR